MKFLVSLQQRSRTLRFILVRWKSFFRCQWQNCPFSCSISHHRACIAGHYNAFSGDLVSTRSRRFHSKGFQWPLKQALQKSKDWPNENTLSLRSRSLASFFWKWSNRSRKSSIQHYRYTLLSKEICLLFLNFSVDRFGKLSGLFFGQPEGRDTCKCWVAQF